METTKTSIVCLGKSFDNEDERREYFRGELRKKLPELKKVEGFPIGDDDDIINLSDPPYYTACPNPWLNDFIVEWEMQKQKIPGSRNDFHVDEPYASDVSEGKNNPIYNAHSYHTKVPHPAIMRYILHYTQPGDIVLDGFAGTGMTGIAAQLCGAPDPLTKQKIESEWRTMFNKTPEWGARTSIISDLSPIATFIAYNYNIPIDVESFIADTQRMLNEVEDECGWMYETIHNNGAKAKINFTIWSDVYSCPECNSEIIYWETAIDKEKDEIKEIFQCPTCKKQLNKSDLERVWVTSYDPYLNQTIRLTKSLPVFINYSINGKRYGKLPDEFDLSLIQKVQAISIPYSFPKDPIVKGDKTGEPLRIGIQNVHQFYTHRNLYTLSCAINKFQGANKFLITALVRTMSKMFRWAPGGKHTAGTSGTLYLPSISHEYPIFEAVNRRIKIFEDLLKAKSKFQPGKFVTYCGSASIIPCDQNSVDYIFTDPPFGSNLMYSELNFLWESWIKVKTNNELEAIENKTQRKTLLDYQDIMTSCFQEYFRVLKPGKWMTVEFSNTSAAVWNGIQIAIQRAGFIIANVAGLDKKQGSFNSINNPISVKQDLVISCYKPSSDFERRIKSQYGEIAVWDFVAQHLHHLPAHVRKDNSTTAIIERSSKILYDRLITYYLMRRLPVPIDAKDFQEGLKQRFVERDGMYFTAEQAAEYDEKKALAPQFIQLSLIVTNESDAIEWLKDRLRKKQQKYQDIMPDFRIATQSLRKGDTLPELQNILDENFIQESDGKWRIPDMNEMKDRESLRTKVLLKEFEGYVNVINQPKAKKLKEVRVEALRVGFKNSWEKKSFEVIVKVGDMIPQNILLEDEQLLMYYDIAKDRV